MAGADERPDAAAEADSAAPGPGQILRAAREAGGLSVDDVAHELRLDIEVVRGIESGDLDSLGAPVFVKGYLRSYARLLELPENDIVDAWQPPAGESQALSSSAMQVDMKPGASLPTFVSWVLLALLVLGAVIYLLSGDDDTGGSAAVQPVQDAPRVEPAAAPAPARPLPREDFVVETPAPAAPVSAPEPPPAAPTEPEPVVAEPPPAPATVSLELEFSDECWVELSAAGRRLLYGLEKPGNVRRFEAQPPLRFFVGNVDAVTIRLDGRDYIVPARVRTGRNTARFALERQDIETLQ